MADTVAPMITDSVTTDVEPGGIGEELYVVRGDAGAVALAWCPSEGRVSFDVNVHGYAITVPVRAAPGSTAVTDLDLEVDLDSVAVAHELADWIAGKLDIPESTPGEPAARGTSGTVMFRVSDGGDAVALAWDPTRGRAYYEVRAEAVELRVPPQVERSPGHANVDARVTVDFASPAIAFSLVAWIRATIPREDPKPDADAGEGDSGETDDR